MGTKDALKIMEKKNCPQCGKPITMIGSKLEEGTDRYMNVYICSDPICKKILFNNPYM